MPQYLPYFYDHYLSSIDYNKLNKNFSFVYDLLGKKYRGGPESTKLLLLVTNLLEKETNKIISPIDFNPLDFKGNIEEKYHILILAGIKKWYRNSTTIDDNIYSQLVSSILNYNKINRNGRRYNYEFISKVSI